MRIGQPTWYEKSVNIPDIAPKAICKNELLPSTTNFSRSDENMTPMGSSADQKYRKLMGRNIPENIIENFDFEKNINYGYQ